MTAAGYDRWTAAEHAANIITEFKASGDTRRRICIRTPGGKCVAVFDMQKREQGQ